LQLTNGGTNEAGTAFCTTPVDIRGFSTDFTFQLSNPEADGITFTVRILPPAPAHWALWAEDSVMAPMPLEKLWESAKAWL
jgi:hypothetical protein